MSTTAAAAVAKKRVRRQKMFLAVGTVVLLGILGFQLPKMLGGHGTQTVEEVTTASPAPAVASPVAAAAALRDTDRFAVQRDTSQLLSFGLFKSKDPFVQQLSNTTSPQAATPAAPAAPAVQATTKKGTNKSATTPAKVNASTVPSAPSVITKPATSPTSTTPVIPATPVPAGPTPVTPTPTAPPSTAATALLSTNGVCEQVALKGTFPATENIFRLVEIAKDGKSVKIAIAGGSYDSGQATATVKLGQKLTLVNTSDGSRYVIVLEAKCSPTAPAAGTASASGAGTPVVTPPAPPAPTSTTPIVTDPYDTTPPPSG